MCAWLFPNGLWMRLASRSFGSWPRCARGDRQTGPFAVAAFGGKCGLAGFAGGGIAGQLGRFGRGAVAAAYAFAWGICGFAARLCGAELAGARLGRAGGAGKKLIAAGDWEAAAAVVAMLRWGWRPAEFLQLPEAEKALVIAGLQWEVDIWRKGGG